MTKTPNLPLKTGDFMFYKQYFSPLGDERLGCTAARYLLEAYECDLRKNNDLSEATLGGKTFTKVVFWEYVILCLYKGCVKAESLPQLLDNWSQENFDKFPALRFEAIQIVFDRCCLKTEICPKTKIPENMIPPSYTTRTFAKPHPPTLFP